MKSEADRITDLELLVTHLQRDLEQMHSVVLLQQKDFEELAQQVALLKNALEQNTSTTDERDLNEERPPHY